MSMFIRPTMILDTDLLIAAGTADGEGSHDGIFVIGVCLGAGEPQERMTFQFTSQEERNQTFQELGEYIQSPMDAEDPIPAVQAVEGVPAFEEWVRSQPWRSALPDDMVTRFAACWDASCRYQRALQRREEVEAVCPHVHLSSTGRFCDDCGQMVS